VAGEAREYCEEHEAKPFGCSHREPAGNIDACSLLHFLAARLARLLSVRILTEQARLP
jgi:hypothetical protein